MATRDVILSEHQQQSLEALVRSGRYQGAKLKALKQAARQGWADGSAGRVVDLAADQLEDFVGPLGQRAAQAAKTAG
jgi:antitoxin ParD1/3/4